ncbi:ATP-binding protein [Brevundimonas sp. M20]|uniref:ATP-binding protein n=1 Tax=Brevundimonas sp. M20 TaxID=2591463 RepID=UPI0011479260|nr:ATP-binding protein [Brevundimonas sp. M20]QDH74231.1 AAA family ATPase [Brevundimonas sp. M20]
MSTFRNPLDLNEAIAEKLARFKRAFIPYPPHVHFHERLDYLQRLGRRCRGEPQMGLRVLAPTGSGKSTAALAYIAFVESQRPRTETFIPVIKIELERNSTSKKLMTSILNALGDPYSHHGNELTLKLRVLEYFKRFGVELLIVDEVQHLNYRDSPKNDVTDALKVLLDSGVVPIAFLGTPKAKVLFERNLQLNGRLLPPCDLPPLNSKRAGDRDLFARFVDRLDHVIVDQEILPNLSNFESAGLLPALFEVSDGVVGRVSRLLQVALEAALRRDAQCLERSDISWAIDHWAVPQSFVKANPLIGATHG